MRLQTVPARQGARWVRLGFSTFGQRPIAFAVLFTSIMVAVLLTKWVPLLMFFILPLVPLVSLGFMNATRLVLDGGTPTLRVFIDPLRAERPRVHALLKLGIVYAVATLAIMWFSDAIDGNAPEIALDADLPAAGTADDAAALAALSGPMLGLLLRFGLAGLLSIPFWHAPALISWGGQGCAQALFSSTVACWRNRGAFAIYGISWIGFMLAFSMVIGLILTLVGHPQWLMSASVPMSLIMGTVFYASLYFTFTDCFVDGEENAAQPPAPDVA